MTFYPNDQWSGAEVRCVTMGDTNEVNNPTEPVGPLTLLEPGKVVLIRACLH